MTPIKRQKIDQFLQDFILVLFNILVFLTPFIFTWFNQELFEFNKMIFVYGISIAIATLYLTRMLIRQQWLWHWQKSDWLLLTFLLSQIISTLLSSHPRTSWFGYYTRFNGGLLSTITYLFLFYAAKNNLQKKHYHMIINSLLLSAFLISCYAIPEHFGHSPSCFIVTKNFDVSCWVQDVQNRVFATFGQPNWLAVFLVMIIPITVWQFWQTLENKLTKKSILQLIWLSINLLTTTSALLFSKSRSGILALLIALSCQLLAKIFLEKTQLKKLAKLLIPTALITLAIILIGTPFQLNLNKNKDIPQTNQIAPTVSVPTIQEGGSKSSDIRKVVWRGAFKIWQRYPIFGSGVETFAYSYYLDRPVTHNLLSEWDFLYNKAHNELLNYLATTGAFGLLSYLTLFIALAIYLFKQWRKKQLSNQDVAIAASLLAMFISNFFGFSTVMSNLLFAILAAMLVGEYVAPPKIKNVELSELKLLALLVIMLLAGYLSHSNWRIWKADYLFTNGSNYLSKGDYQSGLDLIQKAILQSPKEALFYDKLASQYSELAIVFAKDGEASSSSKFAQAALQTSDYVLELNPVHLNFYKSRAKIFLRLAQLNKNFYINAKETLLKAIELAPTDAKLYYNLALIEEVLGEKETAIEILEKTIELKSNYGPARQQLAKILSAEGKFTEAAQHYRYILEYIDPNNELAKVALNTLEASLSAEKN